MNLTEFADKHSVSTERIRQLVAMKRIPAVKKSKEWIIPDGTLYPKRHIPWGFKKERGKKHA